MYICSTGSIPVAAALMMKGLSPGAALVMLMAGPAVNLASILVVHKSMGCRFTTIYLMTAQYVQDYLRHSINIINYICSYDEVFQ